MSSAPISAAAVRSACDAHGLGCLAIIDDPGRLDPRGLDRTLADGVGDMGYLHEHRELRLEPARLFPGLRSLIITTLPYQCRAPWNADYKHARYAAGKDYHQLFRKTLARVAQTLAEAHSQPLRSRAFVDSAPVNERQLAQLAGLGWIGRNALLLHPRHGSYHFLGSLALDQAVETLDGGARTDRCGSCHACESACPTAALRDRRVLSERCISYLTIEHHGVIARALAERFDGWWYGCDRCQEVCPWNRFASGANDSRLEGDDAIAQLFQVGEADFDRYFAGRPQRRIGYARFRRNLLVAAFSLGDTHGCQQVLAEDLPLLQAQGRELGLLPPQPSDELTDDAQA